MSVYLGADVNEIRGFSWPPGGTDEELPQLAAIEPPHFVAIYYDGQPLLSTWTKTLFLEQREGRTVYAKVMPLRETLEASKAIADLEAKLARIETDASSKFLNRAKEWIHSESSTDPAAAFFGDFETDEGAVVSIELRRHIGTGKWYYTLSFSLE